MACHESIWVNSVSRLCLAANFSYAGWTCNGSYELASRYKASSQNPHFASRPVLNSFVTPYISSDYLPLSVTHSHSYCLFSNFFLFSFSLPALPRRSFPYSRPPGSKQNPTMRFSILYLFICGIGFTHAIAFPKSR